jgi:hypothetical protein
MAHELIYGLLCSYPNTPKVHEIEGHTLPKKQQKFKRIEMPESFYDLEFDNDGLPIYSDEQITFITREWNRVHEGHWFMNNGYPIYLTGDYYYYLNYWTLESGVNPEFRDSDRKWFLFYNEARNDKDILGIVRVKKRREGATSQSSCILTKLATTNENTRCGIISKTGRDAEDLFQNMVVYGFRSLPIFIQPRTDGSEDPKKKLIFVKQAKKKVAKASMYNKREGLNSFIEWRNTALNSFDSGRWSILLIDEASKFPAEVPILEYWNIAKKTLTEGANKVGFGLMVSTVNPPNNGGQEFKNIWDESDQFKFDRRTPSRLVRYFCPADEGYAGFIDEYGMSMKDKAKEHILAERVMSKQDQDVRDYPLSEIEAFKFNDVDCHFNLDKIEAQQEYLKEKNIPLRRGRLYFDGENKVQFADDKSGNWLVYKFPKNPNKFVIKNNVMYPAATAEYGIGCDPFRHSMISSKGSMGSAFVGEKLDATNPDDTGLPVAHYYGRPKMKKLFWKEMLMASMWYGCPATIESDAGDDYYDYFKSSNEMEMNCLPMLGKKPDAVIDPNRKTKINYNIRGVSSGDAFALGKQLEYCINYIEHHCQKIYYPDLLDELKRYKHDNRTEFDTCVSFQIMLLTLTGQNKAATVTKRTNPLIETFSTSNFIGL